MSRENFYDVRLYPADGTIVLFDNKRGPIRTRFDDDNTRYRSVIAELRAACDQYLDSLDGTISDDVHGDVAGDEVRKRRVPPPPPPPLFSTRCSE